MRIRFTILTLLLAIVTSTARAQTAADGQPAADVVDPASVVAAPAPSPPAAPARPKVDDIFRSMQSSATGPDADVKAHLLPLAIAAVGFVGMLFAIAHWNRVRAARPTPVGDHKKLLKELARATGLSATQLRRLATLSADAGLASPIVAAIAPSVLRDLATRASSDVERMALAKLARQLSKR